MDDATGDPGRAAADAAEIEALLAAAANDPTAAPRFVTELLESTVLVPGTIAPGPDGSGQVADLADLLDADGSRAQPFYTSEARLQETIAAVPGFQARFIALPCRILWQMTRGATLVLNPHSAHGKMFLPGEIGQLLDGAATLDPIVIEKETQVLVGRPAHVPPGMEQALADVFGGHPEVEEARLGWKVTPGSAAGTGPGPAEAGEQTYLLVVTGAPDARAAVSGDLGRALRDRIRRPCTGRGGG
ncbi:SseB family protein [Herbiconiux liangxiaofengii]|uniref:SseB family protein n=1 Tax=Herbiconiux liangxiaofengii TaxID=3342795 RepID=UPI0035B9D2D5